MGLIHTPESKAEFKSHVYQEGHEAGLQDWLYVETSSTREGRALWRLNRFHHHSDTSYRDVYVEGYLAGCNKCVYMEGI